MFNIRRKIKQLRQFNHAETTIHIVALFLDISSVCIHRDVCICTQIISTATEHTLIYDCHLISQLHFHLIDICHNIQYHF